MTLTKEIIIEALSQRGNLTGQNAKAILETMLGLIKEGLSGGDAVKISGFGKWQTKLKNKRRVRNPNTGSFIEIAARRVVTFTSSDKLIEKLQALEPAED